MSEGRALEQPLAAVSNLDVGGVGEGPASRSADFLRHAANALSLSRVVFGVGLGYQIGASEYPAQSWENLMAVGGLAATDYVDGRLARAATAIDGRRSRLGAWLDQMADKVFTVSLLGGVACGSLSSERPEVGLMAATAGAIFTVRDVYVTRQRIMAERASVKIDTAAKWHGKAKTALQFGALVGLASPVMESRPASWSVLALLSASTVMSVYSALKYRRSLNAAA